MKLKKILEEQQKLDEMAMTSRKLYEQVADGLSKCDLPSHMIKIVADSLSEVFEADNPRFDRQRFYKAAGIEDAMSGHERRRGEPL